MLNMVNGITSRVMVGVNKEKAKEVGYSRAVMVT